MSTALSSMLFERYVNSKDNQTERNCFVKPSLFERYVNSKDNQTAQTRTI